MLKLLLLVLCSFHQETSLGYEIFVRVFNGGEKLSATVSFQRQSEGSSRCFGQQQQRLGYPMYHKSAQKNLNGN
jgi:trehalose utilization protein